MKTPEQWKFKYPELLSKELISEIQRDAREGMVPEGDFRALLDALSGYSNDMSYWLIVECIKTLRAKHPNLFTK